MLSSCIVQSVCFCITWFHQNVDLYMLSNHGQFLSYPPTFAGALVNSDKITTGIRWLLKLSFLNYAFEVLMTSQVEGLTILFQPSGFPKPVPVKGEPSVSVHFRPFSYVTVRFRPSPSASVRIRPFLSASVRLFLHSCPLVQCCPPKPIPIKGKRPPPSDAMLSYSMPFDLVPDPSKLFPLPSDPLAGFLKPGPVDGCSPSFSFPCRSFRSIICSVWS